MELKRHIDYQDKECLFAAAFFIVLALFCSAAPWLGFWLCVFAFFNMAPAIHHIITEARHNKG